MNAEKMRAYAAKLDEARDRVKPDRISFVVNDSLLADVPAVQGVIDSHRDRLRSGPVVIETTRSATGHALLVEMRVNTGGETTAM